MTLQTLSPISNPLWTGGRRLSRRSNLVVAATAIAGLHTGLIAYLYVAKIEPLYALQPEPPAVRAVVVRPRPPEDPPPIRRQVRSVRTPPSAPPLAPHVSGAAFKGPADIAPLDLEIPEPPRTPPSPPAPLAPHVISNPLFDRTPSAEEMARFYPERAERLGREGAAEVRCEVSKVGALEACRVLAEDPAGYGFGEAALKLAGIFRLKPATSDGRPVDGGVFTTRIRFRLPE